MKPAELTNTISENFSLMRKSERKVAKFILDNLAEVIHMRIVDLAEAAEVSEPTVVRFCRAINFSGFQGFKLALAQQLASSPSQGKIAVTETDSVSEYTFKVFDSTVDTLLKARDSIDLHMLNLGVEALCSAKRVEFFGFGASAAVAFDAQHKFFRLQISTAAYADPHLQNMSATSMGPGDVVVAISQSGRTTTLINAIEEVKKRGAIVITISPSDTPIAFAGTIPICIDAKEDIEIYTPLSSRIAHLVIIDVLAIGVAKHKGGDLQEHLLDLQIGLESLRAPINS